MSSLRDLILLTLVVGFVPSHCFVYDEKRSVALIEDIDRYSHSPFGEFNDDLLLFDDHGHNGHEEEDESGASRFSNEWVVKITGGRAAADNLADEMGYEIIGEVILKKSLATIQSSSNFYSRSLTLQTCTECIN